MRISVFDIGGTFIKHSIFNGFRLSDLQLLETQAHLGADNLIQKLVRIIREENTQEHLDGVGISTRGQVDFSHGAIIFDPPDLFPDYSGTPLRQQICEGLGDMEIPIVIENDGNCAAVAESIFGASKKHSDSLCLVFGTSIGGGIIHNHEIYRGSNFSAGEFGMIQFPDAHGGSVSFEKQASVTALVSMTSSVDSQLTDGKKIVGALKAGNRLASQVVDEWCFRLAIGLASLIHVFNPSCLILGGGIMESEIIVSRVRQRTLPFLAPGFEQVEILPAALGNNAGMLGAAYLTLQTLSTVQTAGSNIRKD